MFGQAADAVFGVFFALMVIAGLAIFGTALLGILVFGIIAVGEALGM